MSELKEKAAYLHGILNDMGAEKYACILSETEKQELNAEGGAFKLMRTVYGGSASVIYFEGARQGAASGNDLSEEGLRAVAESAKAAAESSPEDPCHDIAPCQGEHVFYQGVYAPDFDRLYSRVTELQEQIAKDFPKVNVMMLVASHDCVHTLYANTNGTKSERFYGSYSVVLEFSASDGERTTGLDYTGVQFDSLDRPLMELGNVREKLENIEKQLGPVPLEGKFEGTVVLTPDCAGEFLYIALQNFAGSANVIDGTSLWLDKVGKRVASDALTVRFDPFDERIVCGERLTGDGFLSEPAAVLENGVLKAHMLSLYAANKTGRPVMKNNCGALIVEPGEASLSDIIASVDKGLLVGGFSGGQPGANGEFSGVAKNSFLIENGKIGRAVTETMISGNLANVLLNIRAISRETIGDGTTVVPYIASDGVVISGK